MPPRITRRQLGGAPPVASVPDPVPYPMIPLPSDRATWPALDSGVMAQAVFAAKVHNCIPDARVIIGMYGGSSTLLVPLFEAQVMAAKAPVALEIALGGTVHPLRLAYVISGMGSTAPQHAIILPLVRAAIDALIATGRVHDHRIATYLGTAVVVAFGEQLQAQLASAESDPLRAGRARPGSSVHTRWDPTTGIGVTTIR